MRVEREVIDAGDGVRLRPMRDADTDYALLAHWRNLPHVRQWWDPDDPPHTTEQARRECGPAIRGEEPDRLAIIEVDGVAAGFVQYYPWAAYADELTAMDLRLPDGAWSLDILIGAPEWLGRGVGSRTVRALCEHLFAVEGAAAVAFGVDRDNARARAAYLKAGMTPMFEYLDLDTRGGERVWCVLMLRTAP
jgi:aminoglycoside 6'-N-acetyltransferase